MHFMSCMLLIGALALCAPGSHCRADIAERKQFQWRLLPEGTRSDAVVKDTPTGCQISLSTIDAPSNYATALAECDLNVPAQYKLTFRYRGYDVNSNAILTPTLVLVKNGEWKSITGQGIRINNREPKRVVLGLNSEFALGDALWNIRQVKFTVNAWTSKAGATAKVDIDDIKIASSEETHSQNQAMIVEPSIHPPVPVYHTGLGPIAVYCDFDNDDLNKDLQSRVTPQRIDDTLQATGFRYALLENTGNLLHLVATPEEADVILHSRASAGPMGERIVHAVRGGKSLFIYGEVKDGAVEAIAPLAVAKLPSQGWAKRAEIQITRAGEKLFSGEQLIQTDWRQYLKSTLKNGAPLATYDDGSPALAQTQVERGRVLQCVPGIGVAWIRSSVLYDRFAIKGIGYLAGRDPAQLKQALDRLEKFTLVQRRARDTIAVVNALAGANTADARAVAGALPSPAQLQNADETQLDSALNTLNTIEKRYCTVDGRRYHAGASLDNFGRFGWMVGEGLLCGEIGNDLTVSNGEQSFRMDADQTISVPLNQWHLRPLDNAVTDISGKAIAEDGEYSFDYAWKGEGRVEYTRAITVEPSWQGKRFMFSVEKGIDDLDEVYLNGRLIGSTTEKTSEYWIAPRAYAVPADVVNWNGANELKIVVRNLRGDARLNSCPKLKISNADAEQAPARLQVTSIDWTHKIYSIQNGGIHYQMTLGLLSPHVLYDFGHAPDVYVGLENTAEFASWCGPRGVRTVDLRKNPAAAYDLTRDGNWTQPWLLLWRAREGRPLLLTFSTQPASISAVLSGETVLGLNIRLGQSDNTVAAGWPWGISTVNSTDWARDWPDDLAAKINQSAALALNFPLRCHEAFTVDRESKRIQMISSFEYRKVEDQWKTPKQNYAFLPPLAGLDTQQGMLVETSDVHNFNIATKFGPLVGANGRHFVRWSLPLPDEQEDLLYARINPDDALSSDINSLFASGAQWSCGGKTPATAWTPADPSGHEYVIKNIDPFCWCFGLGDAVQGYLGLNPENRQILAKRTEARYLEPMELYQYKNAARYRQEPYSGLCYPVLLNSHYKNSTPYASGLGSKVIYGDENEACTVSIWIAQMLANAHGNRQLVERNWSYYQYVMRYMMYIDDWAFSSGSCRESGAGSWIDMLACEYPCMVDYARLARIAGDTTTADQALYRAARRMLPTLMRLRFPAYMAQQGLIPAAESIAVVTGFSESDGAMYMKPPLAGGNFDAANDLFDFSEGFPGTLALLYQNRGLKDIQRYLSDYALPALTPDSRQFKGQAQYLQPLAFYTDALALEQWAKFVVQRDRQVLSDDWIGMRVATSLASVRWRMNHRFHVAVYKNIDIHEATFNASDHTATLEYAPAAPESTLIIECDLVPTEMIHNGQPVAIKVDGKKISLPVTQGTNRVQCRFADPNSSASSKSSTSRGAR